MRALLGDDLRIEEDLSRWFPVWAHRVSRRPGSARMKRPNLLRMRWPNSLRRPPTRSGVNRPDSLRVAAYSPPMQRPNSPSPCEGESHRTPRTARRSPQDRPAQAHTGTEVPSMPPETVTQQRADVIHNIGYRHYDGPRLGRAYARRSLFSQSLRGAYGLGRSAKSKVAPMLLFAVMCMPASIIVAVAIATKVDELPVEYLQMARSSICWPSRCRPTTIFTKLIVAIGVTVAFSAIPTLLAGFLLNGNANQLAVGYAVAAAVASVAYSAVFLLLGTVTRHAVIAGLVYALVWETFFGSLVAGARKLSVQQWALALGQKVADGDVITSDVGLATGVILLLVVTVAATWFGGPQAAHADPRGEE
ncbi:hypothetical protein SANTM175S_07593 [Streptomyces antimycoticus]